MTPANPKSPNAGRTLAALVRRVRLPVNEKSLLRESAASFSPELGGSALGRESLMLYTGLSEDELREARTELAGRGLISVHPRFDGAGNRITTLIVFNEAALRAVAEPERPKRSREDATGAKQGTEGTTKEGATT